jgi:GTP-binding protein EngB required for normal cell division
MREAQGWSPPLSPAWDPPWSGGGHEPWLTENAGTTASPALAEDQTTLIRDFASRCRERIEEFEKTQVRCGLIGPSGSGKSSLINAIAGERIAQVGVVETTTDPLEINHRGITFVDLPGCGTRRWPKDTYVERLNLVSYDCFLLVTAQRFTENDAFLFQQLRALGKPCFVVRNMIDRAIEDGRHDHGHDEAETRRLIQRDITSQLEPDPPERVYLTSARQPAQHDLQALLAAIGTALDGLKQSRFVADMAAYGEDALKRKRKVAQERIPPYAGLAAANGSLNPVPGLDLAADVSLLLKLSDEIASIYGLTSSQFDYIKRLLGPKALPTLIAKIAQFSTRYLAREGLIGLLKRLATREVGRQSTRWIPLAGPLIAAGIGWQSTFMLGEQLVDEAEGLAGEILSDIVEGSEVARGT